MNRFSIVLTVCVFSLFISCSEPAQHVDEQVDWKEQLNKELPLPGHRNWILVVDKAFPMQSSSGMEVINTDENMMTVLKYTLDKINASSHVKPIIYTDREINYVQKYRLPD